MKELIKLKHHGGKSKTSFMDKEIKNKTKTDLRNAAVNSIMKYSMTTIKRSNLPDKKCKYLHQSA